MKIISLPASVLAASITYGAFAYFILDAKDGSVTAALFGAGLGLLAWILNQELKSKVSKTLRNMVLVPAIGLSLLWLFASICAMVHTQEAMPLQSFLLTGLLFFSIGAVSGGANYFASQAIKERKPKASPQI